MMVDGDEGYNNGPNLNNRYPKLLCLLILRKISCT